MNEIGSASFPQIGSLEGRGGLDFAQVMYDEARRAAQAQVSSAAAGTGPLGTVYAEAPPKRNLDQPGQVMRDQIGSFFRMDQDVARDTERLRAGGLYEQFKAAEGLKSNLPPGPEVRAIDGPGSYGLNRPLVGGGGGGGGPASQSSYAAAAAMERGGGVDVVDGVRVNGGTPRSPKDAALRSAQILAETAERQEMRTRATIRFTESMIDFRERSDLRNTYISMFNNFRNAVTQTWGKLTSGG